jgi:flagellin-like protein
LFAALFDVVEPRYRATAAGLMLSAAFVTGASAPLALGWIKSVSGLETGLLLLAVVFAAAGLVLLAARQFTFRRDQIVEVIPDSNVA